MIDTDVKDYDKEFDKVRKRNKEILEIFNKDLSSLSDKTRKGHIDNASLFLEDFFYMEGLEDVVEAAAYVPSFFSFFIDKCVWAAPSSVKSLARSMKKFYSSMEKNGLVEKKECDLVLETIKENLDEWVEESDAGFEDLAFDADDNDFEDDDDDWYTPRREMIIDRNTLFLVLFREYLAKGNLDNQVYYEVEDYMKFVSSFSLDLSGGQSCVNAYLNNQLFSPYRTLSSLSEMVKALRILYKFLFDEGVISKKRYKDETAQMDKSAELIAQMMRNKGLR